MNCQDSFKKLKWYAVLNLIDSKFLNLVKVRILLMELKEKLMLIKNFTNIVHLKKQKILMLLILDKFLKDL